MFGNANKPHKVLVRTTHGMVTHTFPSKDQAKKYAKIFKAKKGTISVTIVVV